jgi:protein ImuB
LVTVLHDGQRQVVGALNGAAASLGLRRGMQVAHARSLVADLLVEPADVAGDAEALGELAVWCLRFAPFTSADAPDGIWIDATGCAHLFGGEQALLSGIVAAFEGAGLQARAAIADTPGAAWAVARNSLAPVSVVPVGGAADALPGLPVAALRLEPEMVIKLGRLGFDTIGQLMQAPRAPLSLRFGTLLVQRLDQAIGRVFEPLSPVLPASVVAERLAFVEPLLTAEAFVDVIGKLADSVCAELERRGSGARQVDLVFERVDGGHQVVRVGTARASRDGRHLARLLGERLDQVDPGLGVEAMRLIVTLADELGFSQSGASLLSDREGQADLSVLVDRLVNRLGADRVYRFAPCESDVPERAVRRVPPLSKPGKASWPVGLPRPTRLLTPPQPVDAIAEMPDRAPAMFVWRKVRHRIKRADGPERIHAEWWKRAQEMHASRDYWQVEDDEGRRFWLYRSGDGEDARTGTLRWYLHGLF